jgi:hypothetical protein
MGRYMPSIGRYNGSPSMGRYMPSIGRYNGSPELAVA